MPKLSSFIGIFLLVFAMLIWGSSFVALKFAMKDLGEYTVIFFRMLIASLCFIYFIKDFSKYEFTKKDKKLILLLAIFEPCLYFIFEAKALLYTSASQAGVITSMMPLITAFFAGYFLKEIISKQLLFGSLLAMMGVIWLSVNASASISAPDPLLGNFLEFCAMVCGTGYTIVTRYLVDKFSPLFITAMQAFIGAVFFFPFFIYELNVKALNFTFEGVASLFYLGVVVTLCGYGLYNFALTKIEASKAAMFINLIPIFTLGLAFLFLGEKLSFQELIACAVILSGVVFSQIKIKRKKRIKI
ncbi:DMT family transporter [Halarcobacter anaerophilus]|uniref:EamA family transporter n=1 Tax=Halarcobacter anaerophilus TaxID=877500 RepID=A0A4V1LQ92_9BACT|nr:DMT family transporter [Halarcobacter anaerophilus]QDF27531.1 DMT family transporter [Halarcobacter anaerophilus]RXJ63888.1 EamA family transporter [Halarcobacter anaerophilus]